MRIHWNKGKKHSEKTKRLISLKAMGRIPWNKGIPRNEETKNKISKANKGKTWKLSSETKRRQGLAKTAEKNPLWKGDKVEYGALHAWIIRRFPKPKLCQCCNLCPPYDLANISQEYKRELSDWEWLCCLCHRTKDGRMEKLRESRTGNPSWNLGKNHSKETRIKISNSHSKKLSKEQVILIRKEYLKGNIILRKLGIKYNVSGSLIHSIVNYKKRIL